ncbi:MAG: SGNH/GDSL hydrolase family protein [Bauldia sp.]|uniref:SGNH/GDSL hydrolase family protein n=1 Tax=Bauldia sp. TaxID=2575872 RepID=UPI001D7FAB8B|nr:SGNH/GDSL hydrolase family protein [Bauldia sp.]MCB1497223.1 SGNH/GDSL hydrolase family protein [Bauldia sp.]
MPKTVLCYGDSNTWGAATVSRPDDRYAPDERWPGIVREALGADWLVIEEGLNGRTTISDDPVEGAEKNGRTYLGPCLQSHRPLDVVVIMLGTNDLKARFDKSPQEIADGIGVLVDMVKAAGAGHSGGTPRIIVVSPAPTREEFPMHAEMFVGAEPKSKKLAGFYRALAEDRGVEFFDAGSVIESSFHDGFHLDPEAHSALGIAIAAEILRD